MQESRVDKLLPKLRAASEGAASGGAAYFEVLRSFLHECDWSELSSIERERVTTSLRFVPSRRHGDPESAYRMEASKVFFLFLVAQSW
jgi:hypothetical protein